MALKAGIIGCGGIAERRHAPVLSRLAPRVELAALADLAAERTGLLGELYGIEEAHQYRDWQQMLDAENLDLVHICTPHHLHCDQAVAALERGAHVLLEKPIATTLEEADRMIAAAQTAKRQLTISHNQLFAAAHRAAMENISTLGRVFLFRSEGFAGSHVQGRGIGQHWRAQASAGGGGPLIDNGFHQIYKALDYIGSPAGRVFAHIGTHVQDSDVEDTALVLIEHQNGATTSIQVGWCAPAGSTRVEELFGTQGQMRFGGDPPLSLWQADTGSWSHPAVKTEGPDELGFPQLVRDFIQVLEGGGTPQITGTASRHVLAIVLAAYESGRTGAPVEVS
ncbi:MAG: hypothetical protein GKR89_12015 [Candidatus Latescibacteria bacterium]|nr:hypothetical protein [Candidatus Latescibacterota bacterium]